MATRVRVHWNLHRGGYSITVKGRVVATPDHVCLRDMRCVVSDASLERMRALGRRKVVAWMEGIPSDHCSARATGDVVTFNPWRAARFHVAGNIARVVTGATHIHLESGTNSAGKACPVARIVED